MPKKEELDRLEEDLQFIKSAIRKSGNIMRWVSWGKALRWVSLGTGLFIIAIALFVGWLNTQYGDFAGAPLWIRVVFFAAIVVFTGLVAYWKIRNILRSVRVLDEKMTVVRLLRDVYGKHTRALITPFFLAIIAGVVFLSMQDLSVWIIPFLSIMFGLVCIITSLQFYFESMYGYGLWMLAAGFIVMFLHDMISPMGALVLSFGASAIFLFAMTFFPKDVERPGGPRG